MGWMKFKGNVWALVALAGVVFALCCVLVAGVVSLTAWISPTEVISLVKTVRTSSSSE